MTELRKKATADKSDKTVKDLIWLLFESTARDLGPIVGVYASNFQSMWRKKSVSLYHFVVSCTCGVDQKFARQNNFQGAYFPHVVDVEFTC